MVPVEHIPQNVIVQCYMCRTVSVETIKPAGKIIILYGIIVTLGIGIIAVVIFGFRWHYIHRIVNVYCRNIVQERAILILNLAGAV